MSFFVESSRHRVVERHEFLELSGSWQADLQRAQEAVEERLAPRAAEAERAIREVAETCMHIMHMYICMHIDTEHMFLFYHRADGECIASAQLGAMISCHVCLALESKLRADGFPMDAAQGIHAGVCVRVCVCVRACVRVCCVLVLCVLSLTSHEHMPPCSTADLPSRSQPFASLCSVRTSETPAPRVHKAQQDT